MAYPWAKWMDGEVHVARYPNDFTCSKSSFIGYLRQRATSKGVAVSVSSPSAAVFEVTFQYHKPGEPSSIETVGRPPLYPWDDWMDGEWHEIKPGVDYHCQTTSMLGFMLQKATDVTKRLEYVGPTRRSHYYKGEKVYTVQHGGSIKFRFVDPEEESDRITDFQPVSYDEIPDDDVVNPFEAAEVEEVPAAPAVARGPYVVDDDVATYNPFV